VPLPGLDEEESTPWQPVVKHARELKIPPGEIVLVDIEISPTSVLFVTTVEGRSLNATMGLPVAPNLVPVYQALPTLCR
jgi:hypothetical protein